MTDSCTSSGATFLPAIGREGRSRETKGQSVRHSSSHRSLSSQSSEKEEGYSSSRASHGSRESIDLDSLSRCTTDQSTPSTNTLLSTDASKHRIAVRPKRRHAASNAVQTGVNAELPSLKEEPGYLSNASEYFNLLDFKN